MRGAQANVVAVRVDELDGRLDGWREDFQAGQPRRHFRIEGRPLMIDLQHAVTDPVAVLMHAAADLEQLLERYPDLLLPERQHSIELVRIEANVQSGFRKLHQNIPSHQSGRIP